MDDTRDPSREVVNESNRSLVVGYGAIRPVINEYPKTASGKRTFSFQSRWYGSSLIPAAGMENIFLIL